MNTIQTSEDLLKQLNEIKTGLEKHVDAKIQPIKDDLDVTIKAFDKFQITNKGARGSMNNDNSFDAQLRKQLFANTDNFNKLNRKEIKSFGFDIKAVGDMTIGGNYSGGNTGISSNVIGIVGGTTRLRHVRDLLRQTTMTGSSLPVLKDNGGEGAPAPTAEGTQKPQMDFDLSEASAKAEVIAGIVIFSKQFLDDVPSAQSWLVQKMIEAYMAAEDTQLLTGNGVSPQLSGMNTSGNFTDATSLSSDNDVMQLVKGIIQLRALERNPTGIIINPNDYGSILLNQATGSGAFDLPSFVTVNTFGQVSILGVPVIDTTAQAVGTYNIIDNEGSVLAFRQATTVEFFESDGNNVQYNKITARIESRIAFPIYGSSYIIKGSFDSES